MPFTQKQDPKQEFAEFQPWKFLSGDNAFMFLKLGQKFLFSIFETLWQYNGEFK